MDKINETQVFCSQCGFVTSNFIEWGDEFWCQEKCVDELPTEAALQAHQDIWDAMRDEFADSDWLASAGWGDDEDYL
jgi:hypothetical protein